MCDEAVAPGRRKFFEEVAATYSENIVDESLQFSRGGHWQVPFEDYAIKTVQGADDKTGELRQEPPYCSHGTLPR